MAFEGALSIGDKDSQDIRWMTPQEIAAERLRDEVNNMTRNWVEERERSEKKKEHRG
jgi:hypothetical protein